MLLFLSEIIKSDINKIKKMKKEEDKLSIFNDMDIMKIKDEDVRDKLVQKKIYKIRDLYYRTE